MGWARVGLGSDWKDDLLLLPLDGSEPRTIPDTKTIDPIRWSSDGKVIFAVEFGSLPARIVRVDVATGRRELWREVAPPDISGVIEIASVLLTPDARSYVYGHSSAVTSALYIVEGLR